MSMQLADNAGTQHYFYDNLTPQMLGELIYRAQNGTMKNDIDYFLKRKYENEDIKIETVYSNINPSIYIIASTQPNKHDGYKRLFHISIHFYITNNDPNSTVKTPLHVTNNRGTRRATHRIRINKKNNKLYFSVGSSVNAEKISYNNIYIADIMLKVLNDYFNKESSLSLQEQIGNHPNLHPDTYQIYKKIKTNSQTQQRRQLSTISVTPDESWPSL